MYVKVYFFLTLLFFSIFFHPAHAQNTQYDVTVVLITKLINFVSWPGEETPEQGKIRLCIVEDPREPQVRPLLLASNVLQKHFSVLPENSFQNCQVIYIGIHPKHKLSNILSKVKQLGPVLTFSAAEDYAKEGVMINFYTEESSVHFEINWDIMKAADLNISSRVLKLARLVE